MAKKRSIMERILLGSEKSEDYARSTLPTNRWQLFWDIFKGSFFKLVKINLLILLFLIPLIFILIMKSGLISGYQNQVPFSQSLGLGYMAIGSLKGAAEGVVLSVNTSLMLFFPVVMLIGALGISGGAYVMRNVVWTEGSFVFRDFWHGIKTSFKKVVLLSLLFSIIIYIFSLATATADVLSVQNQTALATIIKVFAYIILVVCTTIYLHSITMVETYEISVFRAIKNSAVFVIAFFINNLAFLFCAILPLLLYLLGGIFMIIAIIIILLFGISWALLVWTTYSQWIYDTYINDKIPGAKKNRGIYPKAKTTDEDTLRKYKEQLSRLGPSSLGARPVKPITDDEITIEELPQVFSRKDIEKLNASKKALYEDNERYVEEHKNDPEFAIFQAKKDEIDKELEEREKRIQKAKRELKKRRK